MRPLGLYRRRWGLLHCGRADRTVNIKLKKKLIFNDKSPYLRRSWWYGRVNHGQSLPVRKPARGASLAAVSMSISRVAGGDARPEGPPPPGGPASGGDPISSRVWRETYHISTRCEQLVADFLPISGIFFQSYVWRLYVWGKDMIECLNGKRGSGLNFHKSLSHMISGKTDCIYGNAIAYLRIVNHNIRRWGGCENYVLPDKLQKYNGSGESQVLSVQFCWT